MIVKLKEILNNVLFTNSLYRYNYPICYHSVTKNRNDIFLDDNYIHNIHPDIFEKHISQIMRKFTILPIEEYLEEMNKKELRKKANIISITFDDGYKNIFTEAYPILKSYNIPFTIFITTKLLSGDLLWRDKIRIIMLSDLVNSFRDYLYIKAFNLYNNINWNNFYYSTKTSTINSNILEHHVDLFLKENNISTNKPIYLNKEDLSSFSSELVSFGNHSHSHYNMASITAEKQKDDIIKADEIISKYKDKYIKVFAVPFGGLNTYNKDTIRIVNELDYSGIVFTKKLTSSMKLMNDSKYNIYFRNIDLKYTYRILAINRKIY